jgi:hypothetical protein
MNSPNFITNVRMNIALVILPHMIGEPLVGLTGLTGLMGSLRLIRGFLWELFARRFALGLPIFCSFLTLISNIAIIVALGPLNIISLNLCYTPSITISLY